MAAAAAATGLTASAIRFYDDAGVVAPSGRTEAGYRLYDAAAIERLRFAAHSRGLGLSLAETAALLRARDGEECASVRLRLAGVVRDRLRDADRRGRDLRAFTARLTEVARALETAAAGPGPCSADCACVTDPPPTPDACLLDPPALEDRMAAWREAVSGATAREELPGGIRLRFPADPDVAGRLAALAAAEGGCCAPLRFTLSVGGGELVMEVAGPPGLAGLAARIGGAEG